MIFGESITIVAMLSVIALCLFNILIVGVVIPTAHTIRLLVGLFGRKQSDRLAS